MDGGGRARQERRPRHCQEHSVEKMQEQFSAKPTTPVWLLLFLSFDYPVRHAVAY